MNNKFWEVVPAQPDENYIPDAQEIAELTALEEQQKQCPHKNMTEEDGCLDCGFNAK